MTPVALVQLCEFATAHADGTFSVVRGGITTWSGPVFPLKVNLVALVQLAEFSVGPHSLSLVVTGPQGDLLREVRMDAVVADADRALVVAVPMPTVAAVSGRYRFVVTRGRDQVGAASLDVRLQGAPR